jgi:predicted metal-binding membrane protein
MTMTLGLRLRAMTLIALAASGLAWISLARADIGATMDAPLTMGLDAAMFLTLWLAMMFATMLPSVVPMITAFARVQEGRREGDRNVTLFVCGYFLVWTAVGAVAYAVARLAELVMMAPEVAERAPIGLALVIALAGAYQLSPLKSVCLSGCRSPLGFLLAHWRDGAAGALRMGAVHGTVCVGCCWLLFAALFPIGMMNLAAMAALTGLILVEKTFRHGRLVGQTVGFALAVYGLAAAIDPSLLALARM